MTAMDEDVVARLRAAGCVFAEDEAELLISASSSSAVLASLVARRVAGEPLEQILGWVSFCGLRVAIEPDVFVPRQRTALLVRAAVDRLTDSAVVVDLCCGSGALGLAVASLARVPVAVHAADLHPSAVACARRNLAAVGGSVYCGDLFSALPSSLRGTVDVLLCNAPYVPSGFVSSMPPEARDHEPLMTLDGGADGMDLLRRVLAEAGAWVRSGGVVLVECSLEQASVLVSFGASFGLRGSVLTDESLDAVGLLFVAAES